MKHTYPHTINYPFWDLTNSNNNPKKDDIKKLPITRIPKVDKPQANAAILIDNLGDECEYHAVIGKCTFKDCKKNHTNALIIPLH